MNKALEALEDFVNSRPGFDPRNYDSARSYREDYSVALRDLHDARALLRAMRWRDSITEERVMQEAKGKRLSLSRTQDGRVQIDYCTGQYYPTEYRRAVCRLLASVFWVYLREDCGHSTGDAIRAAARRELGARLARRWFS